jgi:hypothetical protein
MRREWELTKIVKAYDPMLYVKRAENGMMFVIRNAVKYEAFEYNGDTIYYPVKDPQTVLPLTDTWSIKGNPVDCGIERLMDRLKRIDAQRSDSVLEEFYASHEQHERAVDKERELEIEAATYEIHGHFKKLFKDFNVSSMDKTDVRKKLEQKLER